MKLIVLWMLMNTYTSSTYINLPEIRQAYELAANDETIANNLLKKVDLLSSTSTTMEGYKGAITMMLAKFQFNPVSKFSYFNKGKAILEQAIVKDKNNIEIIYLRYCIQCNVPSFLDYKNNIPTDKQFLLSNLSKLKDNDLKIRIMSFLKSSGNLSAAEYKLLH